MARPTRRARAQAAARRRSEPNLPHHLMRRPGPATLEPPEAAPIPESDQVAPADAPRVDRAFAAPYRTPAPAVASPSAARAARAEQEIAARRSVTDYGYVIGELKRIFITALIVVVALIVIALIRR